MAASQRLDPNQLGTTLEKGQTQKQKARESQQPHRDRISAGDSAADDTNSKQERQNKYIHERLFLEMKGVGESESGVKSQRGGGHGRKHGSENEAEREEDRRQDHSKPERKIAAGKWAKAFGWMTTVGFQIEQIVTDVNAGRDKAPGNEHGDGASDGFGVQVCVTGDQRQEDEDILAPLVTAQRADQRGESAGPRSKLNKIACVLGEATSDLRCRIGDQARSGGFPHRKIGAFIAGIIEAAGPVAFAKKLRFVMAGEIGLTVRC